MTERTGEPREWPLRDWAARLRPPGGVGPSPGPAGEPEQAFEPVLEPLPEAEPDPVAPAGLPEAEAPPAEQLEALEYRAEALPEPEEALPAIEEALPAIEEHAAGQFRVPGGYSVLAGTPAGRRLAVAIVVSRFNGEITGRLLDSALGELEVAGVGREAILVMPVPGAFELPIAAMALAKTRRYACVVALGCVIRGETPHFELVASEAASGLQLAAIETGVPVAFGLLTCDTREQAEARVGRGAEAVRTALEMADVFAQLRATAAAAQAQ